MSPTIFFLLGVILIGISLRDFWLGMQCRKWVKYSAIITSSEVKSGRGKYGTDHWPEIKYTFQVDGRELTGDRLRFGIMTAIKGEAERRVSQYPEGKKVIVSYDKLSGRMTLESGTTEGTIFLMIVGICLTCLAIGLMTAYIIK